MDSERWSDRVRIVRKRLALSQSDLANKLLCNRATIALWEARTFEPYSAAADAFRELEKEVMGFEEPKIVPPPLRWED